MKKVLPFLCLLITTSVFCQNPELFEHTWYAKSITINNDVTEAPKNPNLEIQATFDGTTSFTDMCCAGILNMALDYNPNQSTFEITDFSPALEICDETENNEFRDLFISFFQDPVTDIFEYEIVDEQNYWDYKILTLTNANGDAVQLYNTPHSIDTDEYIFDIYNGHWFLQSLSNEDVPYTIPYNIAEEIEISFDTDGAFKSVICGEINSKVIFNGDDFQGDFYIPCGNLTFISGECNNQEFIDIEQDLYVILEKIAEGQTFTFQRFHADFGEGNCETTEIVEIYDATRDFGFTLVDCLEPLSVENFNKPSVSIYPNPVKDKLILKNTNFETSQLNLSIYTIQGKAVVSKNIQFENKTSIDVSGLSSGMYFINIKDEIGTTTTQKFVKY